jgi:hypothetical protein
VKTNRTTLLRDKIKVDLECGGNSAGEERMEKLRRIAAGLWKLVFSGILSLCLGSVLMSAYRYPGVHIVNESGATDYKWRPNQRKATMIEGFTWLRMDDNGFNNAYEPVGERVDILLMGSSQMEATTIAAKENTGYLLNETLPEYTYNIGISGHTIYTCVKNLKAAVNEYQPTEYVILETASVELSVQDMQAVLEGTYAIIPSHDHGLLYILQKALPVLQTLYKQTRDWKNEGIEETEEIEQVYDETYAAALDAFLAKAATPVADSGAKLIIFYQPPTAIDEDGNYMDSTDLEAKALFQDACEENGILFVDMTEPFEELYNEQHRLAHGFINTGVGVGHMNKYGHQVIADTLVDVIRTDKMEGENSDAHSLWVRNLDWRDEIPYGAGSGMCRTCCIFGIF